MKSKWYIDNPTEDLRDGWYIETMPGVGGKTMFVRYNGVTKRATIWAHDLNHSRDTMWYRARAGKSPEEILKPSTRNHPKQREKTKLYPKTDTPSFCDVRPFGEIYAKPCGLGWDYR